MTDADVDVAVIGAGLAGAGIACAMASRGWRTVLFDRHALPRRKVRHKVCGEFLSPDSRAALDALGLRPLVESLGPAAMEQVRLVSAGGTSLAVPLPGVALGISRHALDEAVLRAALARGGEWRPGAPVTSVERHGRGYRLVWRDRDRSRILEARAVIGAWGRHTVPGLAAGPAAPGLAAETLAADEPRGIGQSRAVHKSLAAESRRAAESRTAADPRLARSPRDAFVGVSVHLAGIVPERSVELYFFRDGYAGLAPIEGGRYNLAALVGWRAFRSYGGTVHGVMEAAARHNASLRQRLAGGDPVPGTEAAVAPVVISRRPVPWGVVPHLGDAAAVVPPLCGDGMAMALRSAALCAPLADAFLRGDIPLDEWKRAYSTALLAEWQGPLRWGNRLQQLVCAPLLLDLALRAGRLFPALAQRFVLATRLRD